MGLAQECFKRSLEALMQEKEALQHKLDQGRLNLEFDHTELEGTKVFLSQPSPVVARSTLTSQWGHPRLASHHPCGLAPP